MSDEKEGEEMEILSPAFEQHKTIPAKYTCQGENVSPPLIFKNIPKEAKSLTLIMDDPDAPGGTFDHWIVWDIPATSSGLKEAEANLTTGLNSYGDNQYKGPCPPPGTPHRYFFKLYALDAELSLPSKTNKKFLEKAMEGHILAKAELVGIFQR